MSAEVIKDEKKPAKVVDLDMKTEVPWLTERLILFVKHGSHAYGTAIPESDNDYKGIVIPPLPYFFGCGENHFEQAVSSSPDLVFYDIRKFIRLASKANPNILEMLFVNPEDILYCHPLAGAIIKNRDLFVTQLVAQTFTGYAFSAIKAIKKSLENPPTRKNAKRAKLIEDFGFDTKDAAHVVRLMRMGMEILEGKGVIVRRPDAEDLLNIRAGGWEAQKVFEFAAFAEKKMAELLKKTKLPPAPDMDKIEALCVTLVQASFDHEIMMPVMQNGFKTMPMTFSAANLVARKLSPEQEA